MKAQSNLASISDKIELIYTLYNGVQVAKIIKDRFDNEVVNLCGWCGQEIDQSKSLCKTCQEVYGQGEVK